MPSSIPSNAAEDTELFLKVIKSASKQAVKTGAIKAELPDDYAKFLSQQFSYTFDLIKKGKKITPGSLAVLLSQSALSATDLNVSSRYDCAITSALLATSLVKAFALTTFTGPAHFAVTTAELLAEVYGADKACGLSAAAERKIIETTAPAYNWMESGIMQALSQGRF